MNAEAGRDGCAGGSCGCNSGGVNRRDVLKLTAVALAAAATGTGAVAGPFEEADFQKLVPLDKKLKPEWLRALPQRGQPSSWTGDALQTIGMPVGGICAGQLYLAGDGQLWHWDIFNLTPAGNFTNGGGPDYANPPKPASPIDQGFAVRVRAGARTLVRALDSRGFDRSHIRFTNQYPVGQVEYRDPALPVRIALEAFSPFIPLNVDDSSYPATLMNYTVTNTSDQPVEVDLGAWMENGVCLQSAREGLGARTNRIVRRPGLTLVSCTAEPAKDDGAPKRPDILFEDFENGYGKWKAEGEAFGTEPATGTLPNQQEVSGFQGKRLVNSFLRGDVTTGKLISEPFKVERRYIAFLVGGGSHARQTCINLVVDGKIAHTTRGRDNERLEWAHWDVAGIQGRQAHIEIVDNNTTAWGHVNVDQILFTDRPANIRPIDQAEDFGSMAVAVLAGGDDAFAVARILDKPAEQLFAAPDPAESASAPFGSHLTGGVGRRMKLAPGASAQTTFLVTWFFPRPPERRFDALTEGPTLRRSYINRFDSAAAVATHLASNLDRLTAQTRLWQQTWYGSTLPYWLLERTIIPICTLATSTCYIFQTGRFYAYEGVLCCAGTCQHVWNYAQSVARIFPQLERDLRQRTDFGTAWHENGALDYRGEYARHVAHDGQCGVIMRTWREHTMSPDSAMLKAIWPRVRKSIEYLIACDADDNGILEGEQYNTLDESWFGPMAWISSLYIGALRAGQAMATEMSDPAFATRCATIAERGSQRLVSNLYNGEYFIHKPDPKHPDATNSNNGCHIDQLMGQAWATQVSLGRIVPPDKARSALQAIWKYNFTPDVGPFRKNSVIKGGRWYAMPGEGGVIMTTFPHGGADHASSKGHFAYYFNEVWTGQEHQLAAHMLAEGMTTEALAISRMVQDRHDASRRNPFNEIECSDHYTRAMSSHGTFISACGYEHHGPKAHLAFAPRLSPEDFRAAFTAAEGWGSFSQKRSANSLDATIEVAWGKLRLRTLSLAPENGATQATVKLNGTETPAKLAMADGKATLTFDNELAINTGGKLEVSLR